MLLTLTWGAAAAADSTGPQRVVSVNLCTDQLLVMLLPATRIASLSRLAVDAGISQLRASQLQSLANIPLNTGLAEEILPLNPDLLVAGRYTAQPTVALLQRLGVPLLRLDIAHSLADIRQHLRQLGSALAVETRAETLIDQFDARLAALRIADPAARPLAIYLEPNGYTAGTGSLVDDIMRQAGLRNLGAELGIAGHGKVSLEQVLMAGPELLVLDQPGSAYPSLATEFLSHPALQALAQRVPRVMIPPRLWICGLPSSLDALEMLVDARLGLLCREKACLAPARDVSATLSVPVPVPVSVQ